MHDVPVSQNRIKPASGSISDETVSIGARHLSVHFVGTDFRLLVLFFGGVEFRLKMGVNTFCLLGGKARDGFIFPHGCVGSSNLKNLFRPASCWIWRPSVRLEVKPAAWLGLSPYA